MEDTKKCPKCEGEMAIGEEFGPGWKPIKQLTWFRADKFYTYVCAKCGFMESYLAKKA